MSHVIDTLVCEFDYDDPRPEQIDLVDIATSLGNTCRWRGFVTSYISVAEHAVLVARLVYRTSGSRQLALAALHHDSHEAYLGDVPTPLKKKLGEGWQEIVRPIDEAIATRFGFPVLMFRHPQIKAADITALGWEAAVLKPQGRATTGAGEIVQVPPALVPDWAVACEDPGTASLLFRLAHLQYGGPRS